MTPQQREFALRLSIECDESAQAWANEVDTRQRAAILLRALAAEPVPWGHCCDNSVVASHAKRLAMELECLLLDSASSNWWASGNEALEHYRADLDRLYPQDHVSPMGSE